MQDLGAEAGYEKLHAFPTIPARGAKRNSTPAPAPDRSASLDRLIETQILPRLLASRRGQTAPPTPLRARVRPDAERFARALVAREPEAAFAYIADCRRAGVDDATLMIEAFAPAARRLGALWEEDLCDFLEVTEGLARLEAMLGELGREHDLLVPIAAPALLLMTAPGETHFLGPDIAAELLRREGWNVERAGPEGLDLIAGRRFEAIGFSISCERYLPGLVDLIAEARAAAAPRRPAVVVGGALFAGGTRNAPELDADFVAADAEATLCISRSLLARRRISAAL
jgi:hypothetical protein